MKGLVVCSGFHALLGTEPHKSQSVQNTLVMLCARVVARISFFFLPQAVADFLPLHGNKHTSRLPSDGPDIPEANSARQSINLIFKNLSKSMKPYKPTVNVHRAKNVDCMKNDVSMWMSSHKKIAMSRSSANMEPIDAAVPVNSLADILY